MIVLSAGVGEREGDCASAGVAAPLVSFDLIFGSYSMFLCSKLKR